LRSCCRVQQTCFLAGIRIFFGHVGKREEVRREEETRHGLRVVRRLSKAMIEAASPSARHMGYDAIQHLPALLVGVEILIDKMPEKAPTLGNSNGIGALYR